MARMQIPCDAMRIGVDLGGTKIEAVALDDDGRELVRTRVPTPRGSYDDTLAAIVDLVHGVEREAHERERDAVESETVEREAGERSGIERDADERGANARATVGVGIPGAISPATGRVKNANSTWLNGRALADDLPRLLDRPVRFANDANCFTLSEATDGAAAGAAVVFGVIVGTGTGGGVVVNGRVVVGANAIAGEWGHNPRPWPRDDERPGPACYCGQCGCIETFLSGPGLARDYSATANGAAAPRATIDDARGEGGTIVESQANANTIANGVAINDATGNKVTIMRAETETGTGTIADAIEIVARARANEPRAVACLDRYIDRMARGLASVINVLDPDVIVLGGGLSNIDRLYEAVPAKWGAYVFSDRVDTRLVRAKYGDSSG